MIRWLLPLLLLTACADPPADLTAPCPLSALPPQPPAAGKRTIKSVAAWANTLQVSREQADLVYAECRERHARLAAWAMQHRGF